jgi:tRNA-specific 2-thiouridylase
MIAQKIHNDLDKNKVAIGLSGGVDSTAAAYLLKKEGYEVIGLTMQLFDTYDDNGEIKEDQTIKDAKAVAKKLNIEHHILDYREIFKKEIINNFRDEYLIGRTPNPCVRCNKVIKFGALLTSAHALGAYYLATGHYSRIDFDENRNEYKVLKGTAEKKDQAYMFHVLTQEQLKYIKFPLGHFKTKKKIREIAKLVDVELADKDDSQDICFIKDNDYSKFLKEELKVQPKYGNFVDIYGNILGRHKGIINYTIGQRRGLGIAIGKPAYVIKINPRRNEVVIGDNAHTFKKGFIGKSYNFLKVIEFDGLDVEVKIRYSAKPSPATIYRTSNDGIKVIFHKKERAITPGQAAVFYINDEVIGGVNVDRVIEE